MRTRMIAPLVLAVVTILITGCGDSDSDGDSSGDDSSGDDNAEALTAEAVALMDEGDVVDETGQGTVNVDARDNVFKPKYIEVSKGTTVDFINEGRNIHNVLPVEEGAFTAIESDAFDPGDEGMITFDEVGEFPYYCSLHGTKTKGMIGGIRVVE